MDLSPSVGGPGQQQVAAQYGGGVYQLAPPLLLTQPDPALKLGLYPGLVMPTVFPPQSLVMSPNMNTIAHLPFNYYNIVPAPQAPRPPRPQVKRGDRNTGFPSCNPWRKIDSLFPR